jgi:hypothetical protein
MNYFKTYTTLIFALKLIFIILALTNIYLNVYKPSNSVLINTVDYWKAMVEFVFVCLTALLLIYLFAPPMNKSTEIVGETKLLLFMFGFALLITAKWGDFFNEPRLFMNIQNIIGMNE